MSRSVLSSRAGKLEEFSQQSQSASIIYSVSDFVDSIVVETNQLHEFWQCAGIFLSIV